MRWSHKSRLVHRLFVEEIIFNELSNILRCLAGRVEKKQNPQGIAKDEYLAQIGKSPIVKSLEQLGRESLSPRVRIPNRACSRAVTVVLKGVYVYHRLD